MSILAARGFGTMNGINLRTGWATLLAWTLGVVAMMVLTATSIVALYDTPETLASYGASIGDSMLLLNGRVAGLDELGGVVANEFAIVLSFGVPLMAIALTSRRTRKDEEMGRLELLLAARIGRDAPLLAAVTMAAAAILVAAVGCSLTMIAIGTDAGGAVRYGAVIVGLGWFFVGLTAVAAQFFEHNRTVWSACLVLLLALFLLRGVGATQDSALTWLSPLGWGDEVRAFGDDARWWPLLLLVGSATALAVLAFALGRRRDVGGALLQARPAAPRASAALRTPLGLAWYEHRNAIIGWSLASAILMGTYGSLTQEIMDAIRDNPALGNMLGADAAAAVDTLLPTIMSTFLLMLALLVAAFVVMSAGSLRGGEEAGRLESELSAPRGRIPWLATHLLVVAVGAAVIGTLGALAMAYGVAEATGDSAWIGEILGGAVAYVAPVVAFLGLVVAVFGLVPSRQSLVWALFAVCAVLAYLGPGFDLPSWVVNASIFAAVGSDVIGAGADPTGVWVVSVLGVALLVAGTVGFRSRDLPTL